MLANRLVRLIGQASLRVRPVAREGRGVVLDPCSQWRSVGRLLLQLFHQLAQPTHAE